MSGLLNLTQAEHDQLAELTRRATRPASPDQRGAADPARAAALRLAGVRVVLGAEVAAALGDQPWQAHVVHGETVPDADRVILGAVLIFHHVEASWMVIGDELGRLYMLDSPAAPEGIAEPQLVDSADAPAALASPLKTYRVRGVAMAMAFDPATRIWYRSRRVATVTAPTAP